MGRIRSIRDTMKIIKDDDPNTAVTEYMLRQLVIEGEIPCFKTGNKRLVDVDVVFKYLYKK